MNNKECYQLNLDFNGHYIRGHIVSHDDNDFIALEQAEANCGALFNIKSVDDRIYVSKNAIICYFKIS